MTTIYVVTSGLYSDYHIEAVFSTMEKADAYVIRRTEHDQYFEGEVEEYELDDVNTDWLSGRVNFWEVTFERGRADVKEVRLSDEQPQEREAGDDMGYYRCWVYADTRERAVKVAMERRSVWLANQGFRHKGTEQP